MLQHLVDHEYKLLTTAQKLHALRKRFTDAYIRENLDGCLRGNREALLMLLNKHHTEGSYIEREELVDKDIIESMRGE